MNKNQLKRALAYGGITQTAAAAALGISPQNFYNKLQRMSFNESELATLAAAVNAQYVSCFEFTNESGEKIRI